MDGKMTWNVGERYYELGSEYQGNKQGYVQPRPNIRKKETAENTSQTQAQPRVYLILKDSHFCQ